MFGSLSTKIAHSAVTATTLGSQELRPLQEAITKEKEIVTSAQRLSKDWSVAADALKQWGSSEGDDLGDISIAAMTISSHITAAFNAFAEHELMVRSQLKEVRTKEEQLDELRRRRRTVAGKLDAQEKKLSKMGPENKGLALANEQLAAIQNELRQLDTSILVDMARLSDHKRAVMRSTLTLKFGGLAELGEKLTIVGELGKLLASEVPQDVTPPGQGRAPYTGREATSGVVAEAARCVGEVVFKPNPDMEHSSKAGHRMSSSTQGAHTLVVPPGPGNPAGVGGGVGGGIGAASRFRENSHSSLGVSPTQPTVGPVDEFGRPLDGRPRPQPMHATMPSLGGGMGPNSPIQQAPLSAIQQSMRGPSMSGSEYTPGSAGGSHIQGGFVYANPGSSSMAGPSSSKFHPPPPPPALAGQHQQRPSQAQVAYPNSNVTVERGLTLSLPLRSRSEKEEEEEDSPFASPNNAPPPTNPSGAPSAFKPPQPQPGRKETTDSDIVLGGDVADLKRTTTLPPTLKMDDLPAWSLGLGELGIESPTKSQAQASKQEKKNDSPPGSRALTDEPFSAETKKGVTPLSAVPRGLQDGTGSASQTPLTQTPTTYLDDQNAGGGAAQQSPAASPDTPVIQHHVVDDPRTRGQGNSGRFAMFPDKRKPTLDAFPVHLGSIISSGSPVDESLQPKSILVDSAQQSRSGTEQTSSEYPDGSRLEGGSETASRIRFAPRPSSPSATSSTGVQPVAEDAHAKEATDASVDDRRLSAISPLGLHKPKDGSQPTTPHHGAFSKEPTLSEEQFNAMLDSFEANLGSPNTSSNAPTSGPESGIDSSMDSNANKGNTGVPSARDGTFPRVSEAVNESSLDSTAAVAGSPFPSPTPTAARPTQSFASVDASRGSGTFAGVGSAAYSRGRGPVSGEVPMREQRNEIDDNDDSDDSSPAKTISAGAFKRGPMSKQGHSAPSSAHVSPAPSIQHHGPPSGYTRESKTQPPHDSDEDSELPYQAHPAQDETPQPSYTPTTAPPVGPTRGYSNYQTAPSVYQTAQSTPNMEGLSIGAAPPARFGPPQGEQQAYNQQSQSPSQWSNQPMAYPNNMDRQSPKLQPPAIPSSLLPARPGSATPLAPIGHTIPLGSNRQMSPPPPGSPAYMTPSYVAPRGVAAPPWQQQPQQYRVPSPMNDGNVGIHDAYGGMGSEPRYGAGPPASQGNWNAGTGPYNPNPVPRGWNGS